MAPDKNQNNITPPHPLVPPHWYRSVASKSITLNIILAIAVLILGFDKLNEPGIETKYFAVSNDGRVTDLIPLNQSHESTPKIAQWATEAMVETFAWNFTNYKERTDSACQRYFTAAGCGGYKKSLEEENILSYVTNNRLLVSAVVTETPIMVNKGISPEGVYFWKLQLPLRVTYESSTERKHQGQIVTVTIIRESLANKPRGLGIDDIVYQKHFDL